MGKTFNLAETFGDALRAVPKSGTGREQIEYIDEALISGDARNFYELSGLEELASNIELIGLQQPIRLRPDPDDAGGYIIVSGHRRMAAIRQYLKPEAPDKWAQVPCIVERDNASPNMQELRLIYANSATREMSNPDKAKQAARVKELLYKLSEEGVRFPGRMRDHVAEAVNASKSQIARWEVIQKGLIPELAAKWERNQLKEAQAYALARFPADFQRRIIKATPKVEKYDANCMEGVLDAVLHQRRTYEPCMTCPDGTSCSRGNSFLLHDLSSRWNHCYGARCCMECGDGAKCNMGNGGCDHMCAKAQAARHDRADKEKAAAEKKRLEELSRDHADEAAACRRILRAAEAAGLDMTAKIMTGNYYNSGHAETLEAISARADGNFEDYYAYTQTVRSTDSRIILRQAQTLGCSVDYLLGLSAEPRPAAGGAQAAPLAGWAESPAVPTHDCTCAAVIELGELEPGKVETDEVLLSWRGDAWCWRHDRDHKIDMPVLRWVELPKDHKGKGVE